MDEPATKRRRTSPPEELDRTLSPLKKPPRRPSYASPTKASINRSYPGLSRPPSSSSAAARPTSRDHKGQVRASLSDAAESQLVEEASQHEESSQTDAAAQEHRALSEPAKAPNTRRPGSPIRASLPLDDMQEVDAENVFMHRNSILYSSPTKRPRRLKDATWWNTEAVPEQKNKDRSKLHAVEGDDHEFLHREEEKDRRPTFVDPELVEKQQEKMRLLKELQTLENEVAQCKDEIQKIHASSATQILRPAERDKLINFINKIGSPDEASDNEATPAVSSILCSFLPFTSQSIPARKQGNGAEEPVPSHRPLELDDPLPYLRMFTSFEFKSEVSLPKNYGPSSKPAHQVHVIDISGPKKLFTGSIAATIDSHTFEVAQLRIVSLPAWAESELNMFMRSCVRENNLSAACWAIGSYWEIAKKRAEYWFKCQQAFTQLIPGRTSEDVENIGVTVSEPKGGQMSRKDYNRLLGRDKLILQNDDVVLEVSWRIVFDWTGEAESEVHVEPAVPRAWSEADSQAGTEKRNSLKRIPAVFDELLRSRGMFEATKIMVSLLFES